MDMSLSELRELAMDREAWPAAAHVVTKSQTPLSNWTNWYWQMTGLNTEVLTDGIKADKSKFWGQQPTKSFGITPKYAHKTNKSLLSIFIIQC